MADWRTFFSPSKKAIKHVVRTKKQTTPNFFKGKAIIWNILMLFGWFLRKLYWCDCSSLGQRDLLCGSQDAGSFTLKLKEDDRKMVQQRDRFVKWFSLDIHRILEGVVDWKTLAYDIYTSFMRFRYAIGLWAYVCTPLRACCHVQVTKMISFSLVS